VAPWDPDVVFFQETAAPGILHDLARSMYGVSIQEAAQHVAGNWQCSIVARGKVFNSATSNLPKFMMASVEVMPGQLLEVACVHLRGAVTDVRLYKTEAWRNHAENRRSRQADMFQLLGWQRFFSRRNPSIIGGDFNAPAGDAVFQQLKQQGFRDLWGQVGSGWPNTYPNRLPVLRIDHLWGNESIEPVAARVVQTEGSDHRMVVCDFRLR
jgi:vancomycin resistance protein VanJ